VHEVLGGCPLSWLQALTERRSFCAALCLPNKTLIHKLLVLYYDTKIGNHRAVLYPRTNGLKCVEVQVRRALSGTKVIC
jgi:hypothetical protein